MTRYGGNSDGLVVRGKDLAAVVKPWVDEWHSVYDFVVGIDGVPHHWGPAEDVTPLGPYEWLAQESGVSIRSVHRALYESQYVAFRIADAILTAIGRMGSVEVIPNPRWSLERWAEWYYERTHCDE